MPVIQVYVCSVCKQRKEYGGLHLPNGWIEVSVTSYGTSYCRIECNQEKMNLCEGCAGKALMVLKKE